MTHWARPSTEPPTSHWSSSDEIFQATLIQVLLQRMCLHVLLSLSVGAYPKSPIPNIRILHHILQKTLAGNPSLAPKSDTSNQIFGPSPLKHEAFQTAGWLPDFWESLTNKEAMATLMISTIHQTKTGFLDVFPDLKGGIFHFHLRVSRRLGDYQVALEKEETTNQLYTYDHMIFPIFLEKAWLIWDFIFLEPFNNFTHQNLQKNRGTSDGPTHLLQLVSFCQLSREIWELALTNLSP